MRSDEPDWLRRASSLSLPVGHRLVSAGVLGYPIDLRAKAVNPRLSPAGLELGGEMSDEPIRIRGEVADQMLYVAHAQWGLGCFERYLNGDGEEWLSAARGAARYLVATQARGGRHDGGWVHRLALKHTYPLQPPWVSAMAQGEGASLLVRLYQTTGHEIYSEAAALALRPLRRSVAEGGAVASLGAGQFLEEYPTQRPSLVLNGTFFALWGLHDVGVCLGDTTALADFEALVDVLAQELHRWDTGFWSRYDLYPHTVANLANPFYHRLHITLLEAMLVLAPRPQFSLMAGRFEEYAGSVSAQARAYTQKGLFRIISPRNSIAQRVVPWFGIGAR
jgi:heparosan-N-sulfate-glucuronate 5-epimerase